VQTKRAYPVKTLFANAAWMSPIAGIKLCVSRGGNIPRNAKQRAEGVERIEAAVEPKRELIEIGL